jgi:predicted dehydrogenase
LGCAILLEKPISHSLECVETLEEKAEQNGSRILVGFQFRFHPTLQKAAELLGAGAIGQVLSVRAHWGEYLPNWHPWEDYKQGYAARTDLGGGVILTLSHPLDYMRWLCGEVDAIWAFTGSLNLGLQVEDMAEIGLRFVSGAIGSVHLNYNQQPPVHRLEIVGSQGSLQWDNADGILRVYRGDLNRWELFAPPEGFERNTMFVEEARHFLGVVQGEEAPLCSLQDGKQALEMALAALESGRNNRLIQLNKQDV